MIKVFRTDVEHLQEAERIIHLLSRIYPGSKINFDLEDEDNILRIEGAFFTTQDIVRCVGKSGYTCVELPIVWS
ncbi:hypothetical protein [Olivibacter jilunii]|uniref:hypothetical protein n=1 Tax=Olivibacter jilunii TaxID=985016 RepID=UPI003F1871C7